MNADELAEIWKRLSPRLLIIVRSFGQPAEDAVQEAFVQLSRQEQCPEKPLAWLVKVARNQLSQWHRSGDRRRRRESHSSVADWFCSPIAQIDEALDAQAVTAALQRLPDQQRHIIAMHLWGDLSFREIADLMTISRSQVHRLYQTGIQTMQARFAPDPQSSQRT